MFSDFSRLSRDSGLLKTLQNVFPSGAEAPHVRQHLISKPPGCSYPTGGVSNPNEYDIDEKRLPHYFFQRRAAGCPGAPESVRVLGWPETAPSTATKQTGIRLRAEIQELLLCRRGKEDGRGGGTSCVRRQGSGDFRGRCWEMPITSSWVQRGSVLVGSSSALSSEILWCRFFLRLWLFGSE